MVVWGHSQWHTDCVSSRSDVRGVLHITRVELQSSLSHCHANTLCKACSPLVQMHLASQRIVHYSATTLRGKF